MMDYVGPQEDHSHGHDDHGHGDRMRILSPSPLNRLALISSRPRLRGAKDFRRLYQARVLLPMSVELVWHA